MLNQVNIVLYISSGNYLNFLPGKEVLQTSSNCKQPGLDANWSPGSAKSYNLELWMMFLMQPSKGFPIGVCDQRYFRGSNCWAIKPPICKGVLTFKYSLNGGTRPAKKY